MLASLSEASPEHIKDFLIICLAIASPLIALFSTRRSRIEPQPLEITTTDKFSTRDFCTLKHNEIATRFDRVETDIRNLYREIKSERVHTESLNEARTKETYNHMESIRKELSEKIDDLPPQIIATLKNTKGLI